MERVLRSCYVPACAEKTEFCIYPSAEEYASPNDVSRVRRVFSCCGHVPVGSVRVSPFSFASPAPFLVEA